MSVCLSVVSHGSDELVASLLEKLNNAAELTRVIVTHNKAPAFVPDERSYSFQLHNIINERPLGYGKNNNNAYALCREPFFCVANPDIDIDPDIFIKILGDGSREDMHVLAPQIENFNGIEISKKKLPTPIGLLKKIFCQKDYQDEDAVSGWPCHFFWISGAFMLFSSKVYRALGGFDERFYLYLEDVDICVRTHLLGYSIDISEHVFIKHVGQRASHRRLRYLYWHASSMLKFFWKYRLKERSRICS